MSEAARPPNERNEEIPEIEITPKQLIWGCVDILESFEQECTVKTSSTSILRIKVRVQYEVLGWVAYVLFSFNNTMLANYQLTR